MPPTIGLLFTLLALPVCAFGLVGLSSSTSALLPYVRPGTLATGAAALSLVALIWLAGKAAARSRRALLLVYVPALHLTLFAVVVLTMANALLALAMFRLIVGLWPTGDIMGFWVLMPMVGPLVGAAFVLMALIDAALAVPDQAQPRTIVGAPLDRAHAPELWACIDDVAQSLGVVAPDYLLLMPVANFQAFQCRLDIGAARLEGRGIGCSLPLIDVLDVEEFRAIIGHELAHFGAEHVRFTERYVEVFQRGTDAWRSLAPDPEAPYLGRGLVQAPARMLIAHFVASFSVAERQLARELELRLDATAAAATSPQIAANALVKTRIYAQLWQTVEFSAMVELMQGRSTEPRQLFTNVTAAMLSTADVRAALDDESAGLLDSHPSLETRLSHLGVRGEDLDASLLCVRPARPAAALFGDITALGQQLFMTHVRDRLTAGDLDAVPVVHVEVSDPAAGPSQET